MIEIPAESLPLYHFINAVLTLFNFIMIWVIIRKNDKGELGNVNTSNKKLKGGKE